MSDVRAIYLDAAATAVDLLARTEVAGRWHDASALAQLDVAGLAGHLARAVVQVESVLDGHQPGADRELFDAVGYYLSIEGLFEPDSPTNEDIRLRGIEMAAEGHAALVERARNVLERLESRLPMESPDRTVEAAGHPMLLDEYLRTRLVELAVHVDDLEVSIDADDSIPAADAAIEVLVQVAVARIGSRSALRALARRERASRALRAF
jgi:Mycothiol maleylpyruvate isomerase N-terminal domain